MSVLFKAANRIYRNVSGLVVGIDLSMILGILTSMVGLFASCKNKPTPPPAPASVSTDQQKAAWENSYGMKQRAIDGWDGVAYSPSLVRRVRSSIKRDKKRNGEPFTRQDLDALAIASLDQARSMSHWDLYEATLEAQQ